MNFHINQIIRKLLISFYLLLQNWSKDSIATFRITPSFFIKTFNVMDFLWSILSEQVIYFLQWQFHPFKLLIYNFRKLWWSEKTFHRNGFSDNHLKFFILLAVSSNYCRFIRISKIKNYSRTSPVNKTFYYKVNDKTGRFL